LLIPLAADPSAFLGITYVNQGRVHARGLETEAQMRLMRGVQAAQSFISIEALHVSRRTTLARNSLPSATLASVTMIQPVGRSFELPATLRNMFNEQYSDPASDQNVRDSIAQNGRTVRVSLRWNPSSK
jgi:outer membrane receptor protein involved in Fe transport